MIERILKVIETSKVDGNTQQRFGYLFYLDEIEHLTSLGYVVEIDWSNGETLVKWENK